MTETWTIYSSFPNKQAALAAAREMVKRRLIACANMLDGAVSIYRWQGELCEENEAILIAKTHKTKVKQAIAALKQLHPYELPCIVAYPLGAGYEPFLDWVAEETVD